MRIGIFGSENSHAAILTQLINENTIAELSGMQVVCIGERIHAKRHGLRSNGSWRPSQNLRK